MDSIYDLLEQGLSAKETVYSICKLAKKQNDTAIVDCFNKAVEFSELNAWDSSLKEDER